MKTIEYGVLGACLLGTLVLSGCASPQARGIYAGLYSDDAGRVMETSKMLMTARDRAAIPHLIENLDHEDRNVRSMTAWALNLITENSVKIPYDFLAPAQELHAAQREWKDWYRTKGRTLFPPSQPKRAETPSSRTEGSS